ncbi:MAG TPA: SDR family oxidoreductase [Burkholderiales bacterium]
MSSVDVETLGAEFQKYNIRVNSVSPGRTVTSLWTMRAEQLAKEHGVASEEIIGEFSEEIPIGRFAKPAEIADMVVFLLHTSELRELPVDSGRWRNRSNDLRSTTPAQAKQRKT